MAIKVVVTDLDGTLLNSENQIGREDKKALREVQDKGIQVIFATGRPIDEAKRYIEEIGAYPYFISMNGCRTMNLENGEIYHDEKLPEETVRRVIDILEQTEVFYEVYTDKGVLVPENRKELIHTSGLNSNYRAALMESLHFTNLSESVYGRIYKFFIPMPTKERAQEMYELLNELSDVAVLFSLGHCLEIVPEMCNKAVGLKKICEIIGYKREEILAIGDSENDIELLEFCGIGAAVENANKRLKEIADHIVPSNDKDGVAWAIRKYI